MRILREKMQEFERTVLVPICAKDGLGLGKVIDALERHARVEDKKAQEEQIARERADRIGYEQELDRALSRTLNRRIRYVRHYY